jgi:hypothetical protein
VLSPKGKEEKIMATIRFGSNTFSAGNDFTVVGVDESDHLIMGGFGPPPKKPLVWLRFQEGAAFLNADLADADGEAVLQIKDNVITYNKDNVYTVQQLPENKIPPDRLVVVNQYGETTLDLRREGAGWDFNGDFYHGRWHIVATPEGTTINPASPGV